MLTLLKMSTLQIFSSENRFIQI